MIHKLFPNYYVKSVFDIDFEFIYNQGYKGIIFDIDSTLVPHGSEVTQEIDALFNYIHGIGLKTLFLSNNNSERIQSFNKNIGTQFIPLANKPFKKNYIKAVEMLNLKRSEVILIGDQLFTDILGANLAGIESLLVKYLMHENETKIGKKRHVERIVLISFFASKKILKNKEDKISHFPTIKRKNLSEFSPIFYKVAEKKEILKRNVKNNLKRKKFSEKRLTGKLPNVIHTYKSNLIKTGKGIDPRLQENKAFNIDLSAAKINGVIIEPGEEFSFWHLVGKIKEKNGYKDGRVIINNKVQAGTGGGLCNLANTLNLIVIHSPLDITEVHYHSDALAPDNGERQPLANGTSVAYNYVDYRFKNNTNQRFQICLWCSNNQLNAELRSDVEIPYQYKIQEENHRFVKEEDKFYRKSKIYKVTEDKNTLKELNRELLWNNKSEVMFDYDLIPKQFIK